jgi:hypothetical protein
LDPAMSPLLPPHIGRDISGRPRLLHSVILSGMGLYQSTECGTHSMSIFFESHITRIVVIACEVISSFGLAALLMWLAADKWSFYRQWHHVGPAFGFTQIFGEKPGSVLPTHIEHTASWSTGHLSRVTQAFSSVTSRLKTWSFGTTSPPPASPVIIPDPEDGFDLDPTLQPHPEGHSPQDPPPQPPTPTRRSSSFPPWQQRWRRAIRNVIHVSKALRAEREREFLESKRITDLQSYLRKISVTEEVQQHEAGAATSGIQFDPKGSSLAICGKRLSMRCELGVSDPNSEYDALSTFLKSRILYKVIQQRPQATPTSYRPSTSSDMVMLRRSPINAD